MVIHTQPKLTPRYHIAFSKRHGISQQKTNLQIKKVQLNVHKSMNLTGYSV